MIPVDTLCIAVLGGDNTRRWIERAGMECTVVGHRRGRDKRSGVAVPLHWVEFKDRFRMYCMRSDLFPLTPPKPANSIADAAQRARDVALRSTRYALTL